MNNQSIKFKTNIKCGGCIKTVTPYLNDVAGIKKWEVDTADVDKILSVDLDGVTAETVIEKVEEAGFKISLIA